MVFQTFFSFNPSLNFVKTFLKLLIFSIIPLLYVIVLTMKTIFTIPILQRTRKKKQKHKSKK